MNVKLQKLDDETKIRRDFSLSYLKNINNNLILLPKVDNNDIDRHVWHLFVIKTAHREELQKYLLENGIQTLIHYPIAPHHQLAYKELKYLSLPLTELLHSQVLSLPISPVLTQADINYVIEVINNFHVPN